MVVGIVMDEKNLDLLGDYFVENKLMDKEGTTFSDFLQEVKNGRKLDIPGYES